MINDIFKESLKIERERESQNSSFFESKAFFKILNKLVNSNIEVIDCSDFKRYGIQILTEEEFFRVFNSVMQCHKDKYMQQEITNYSEVYDYYGFIFRVNYSHSNSTLYTIRKENDLKKYRLRQAALNF